MAYIVRVRKNFLHVTALFRFAQPTSFSWKIRKRLLMLFLVRSALSARVLERVAQFQNTKRDILYIKDRKRSDCYFDTRNSCSLWFKIISLHIAARILFISLRTSACNLPLHLWNTDLLRNICQAELRWTRIYPSMFLLYKKSIKYYILKCRSVQIFPNQFREYLRL